MLVNKVHKSTNQKLKVKKYHRRFKLYGNFFQGKKKPVGFLQATMWISGKYYEQVSLQTQTVKK